MSFDLSGQVQKGRPFALGICGALLLRIPAGRFRIDRIQCASWPSAVYNGLYWAVFLLALTLLSAAWLGLWRTGTLSARRVLLMGLFVHLCALWSPPFLSNDTLCYAATGRAMAVFHRSPYEALSSTLPQGDPFLQILPEAWQRGASTYLPGFNALSWAIGRLGGDDIVVHLRLYQILGLLSMLGTALLVASAVRATAIGEQARQAAARAVAVVLFCPLAVIEGTINAHNDGLLALCTAAFVALCARGWHVLAITPLLLALSIKASALLLLLLYLVALSWPVLRGILRGPGPTRIMLGLAVPLLALPLGPELARIVRTYSFSVVRLFGSPQDPVEFCTRSLECLPRAFLRWVAHAPAAAWGVGLLFRVLGGVLLIYVASRMRRDRRFLTGCGTFLFLYYLYLHAYSQPWYLLSLLPLLPWAHPVLGPAMRVFLLSSSAYYAVSIPFDCDPRVVTIALREVAGAAIIILPASVVLLRTALRSRTRGTG